MASNLQTNNNPLPVRTGDPRPSFSKTWMIVSKHGRPSNRRRRSRRPKPEVSAVDPRPTPATDHNASPWTDGTNLWKGLSWVLAAVLALVFLSPLRRISPPDFPSYYFAGRMAVTGELARLYDKQAYEKRWEEVIAQGEPIVPYPNYFIRPAFAAYVCAPLGLLPYRSAWLLSLAFNLGLLGIAVWKLPVWFGRGRGAGDWPLWRPWLAVFMPFLWSIGYAQDTILLTLLVAFSVHLVTRQRQFSAGVLLGLCVVKPHLIWALPLVLFWERKFRAVLAFTLTTLVLAAISFLAVGLEGIEAWVRLILYEQTDFVPHSMFNIRALWINFGPAIGVAAVLIVLSSLGVILWRGSFHQKVAASILSGLLLNPHTYNQDASLLALIPFLHPVAAVRYAVLLPWPYFDPLKDPRNLLTVGMALLYLAVVSVRIYRSQRAALSGNTAPS